MLKKWSKVTRCVVTALMVATFALTVFAACSNEDDEDEDGKKNLSQTTEVFTVKYEVAGLADVFLKNGSRNANIQKNQGDMFTADELWSVTIKEAYDGKYTFDEWYTDAACTTPFADFAVTQHTTLYAKFTAAAGAAAIKVIKYETDKSYMDAKRTILEQLPPSFLSCPPTSVEDGKYFEGWFADQACTNRAEPGAAIGTNGMTLYAKWREL